MGDLSMYLCQKPSLPEAEAKDVTYQILDGLNMMHENGFAHRDLKPNVSLIIIKDRDNSTRGHDSQ